MGRRKVNFEQMPARFPEGTLARIDAVLAEGETRTDLLRIAVEREIIARQARKSVEKPQRPAAKRAR